MTYYKYTKKIRFCGALLIFNICWSKLSWEKFFRGFLSVFELPEEVSFFKYLVSFYKMKPDW